MSDHDPPRPEQSSPNNADAGDDRALAAIYHGGEPELPPPALDDRIGAAAATASARRARRRRLPWAAGGLATAAVLVLAVSLVLDQASVAPPDFEPAPVSPAAPPRMAPADADADADADAANDAGAIEELMPARREQRLAPDTARELRSTGQAVRQRPTAASEPAADAGSERSAMTASRREAVDPASPAPVTYADPGCATPVEVPAGALLRPLPDGVEVAVAGDVFQLRCIDGNWARQEADGEQDR
jgi:hypothetical protein